MPEFVKDDPLFELFLSPEAGSLCQALKENKDATGLERTIESMTERALQIIRPAEKVNMALSLHPGSDYDDCATYLTRACELRLARVVGELINKGADVEIEDENVQKYTPLMIAACRGYADIVKILLDNGANPNHSNYNGYNALIAMAVAKKDDASVARLLINAGADINAADECGMTALIYAVYYGSFELAGALIDGGADVTIRDRYFGSALMYLKKSGKPSRLLERLASIDKSCSPDRELLFLCAGGIHSDDDLRKIEELINKGANVNFADEKTKSTPLILLSRYHYNLEGVKLLLKHKANPAAVDIHQKSAISYAREDKNCAPIVRLLISSGASDDKGPLILAAAENGDIQGVGMLLNEGIPADYCSGNGITALHIAVKAYNYEMASLLLKRGADPNRKDSYGMMPLIHLATELCQGHMEFTRNIKMVELLLEYGADPYLEGEQGITAAGCAHSTKLKELFENNSSLANRMKRFLGKFFILF